MTRAPENELGVVFLFASMLKKWQLRVEEIRPSFPDCIAYQKTGRSEKRIRIEFEYRSKNFKLHKHSAGQCDWIVCWEHNWPSVPSGLRVIELRRELGLGFNVWVQPVSGDYAQKLSTRKIWEAWSVPSRASEGDLLLYYHTRPDSCIKEIFVLSGPVKYLKARWKPGKDYFGRIKMLCALKDPVYFEQLRKHKTLRTASFVRGSMRGRPRVTAHWQEVHDLIISKNPGLRKKLTEYSPSRLP